MNLTIRFILVILVISALGAGCGMTKKMDEMADTTGGLAKTTESMNEDTSNLKEMTGEMRLTFRYVFPDARQAAGLDGRINALREMNAAKNTLTKINWAAIHQMGFVFQFWKDYKADDEEMKQALLADGIMEFAREVTEYVEDFNDISPASKSNNKNNLYAMAIALHSVYSGQEIHAKKMGFKPTSMLNIFEEALKTKPLIESGKIKPTSVPKYIDQALRQEPVMVYLLQLRYNFMAGIVLAQISDVNAGGVTGLWSQATNILFNWEPNIYNKNDNQIVDYIEIMKYALETRDLMLRVGLQPKLHWMLRNIYLKMGEPVVRGVGISEQKKEYVREFTSLVRQYVHGQQWKIGQ